MKKYLAILVAVLGRASQYSFAADAPDNVAWITGMPFIENGVLLYKADSPIPGNSFGNVLLVGGQKPFSNVAAILAKAADKHIKLRLYGEIQPYAGGLPLPNEKLPSLQFVVTKIHLPSDPDELPPAQKIMLKHTDTVPGYTVYPKSQ